MARVAARYVTCIGVVNLRILSVSRYSSSKANLSLTQHNRTPVYIKVEKCHQKSIDRHLEDEFGRRYVLFPVPEPTAGFLLGIEPQRSANTGSRRTGLAHRVEFEPRPFLP